MYKKVLTLTCLLLANISLSAMDFNETTSIINEAEKATQTLQNEFDILVNEEPTKQKIVEVNSTIPSLVDVMPIMEVHTIDINSTITVNELNTSCTENNLSIQTHDLNTSIDSNETVPDNGCSDTEIQGKSIRGLIIFKTRIKSVCEMNGEAFAKQYTQEDWDDIYHDKEFKMEIFKACPKIEKRYKDKWTPHLYQFVLEYASDSDAIPEC